MEEGGWGERVADSSGGESVPLELDGCFFSVEAIVGEIEFFGGGRIGRGEGKRSNDGSSNITNKSRFAGRNAHSKKIEKKNNNGMDKKQDKKKEYRYVDSNVLDILLLRKYKCPNLTDSFRGKRMIFFCFSFFRRVTR